MSSHAELRWFNNEPDKPALIVILLTWASHSRVLLRQTPRCGVDETFSTFQGVLEFQVFFYFGPDSAASPDLLDISSGDSLQETVICKETSL